MKPYCWRHNSMRCQDLICNMKQSVFVLITVLKYLPSVYKHGRSNYTQRNQCSDKFRTNTQMDTLTRFGDVLCSNGHCLSWQVSNDPVMISCDCDVFSTHNRRKLCELTILSMRTETVLFPKFQNNFHHYEFALFIRFGISYQLKNFPDLRNF